MNKLLIMMTYECETLDHKSSKKQNNKELFQYSTQKKMKREKNLEMTFHMRNC